MGVFLSTSEGFFCAQEWFIIPCRNQKGNENMRICTFSTKIMNLAWFYFRFNGCFRQISFLGSSFLEKGKEERGHCERGWFSKPLFKFGSFACWKARLTRTGSFQGTSTFLACSAGVLLGRVNAKKLAIVHSTNQCGPSSSCEMIISRNKSHGEIIGVCVGIFMTALRNINTVKSSTKIPHHTSTVCRLLSYRLLCWEEPILASHPFLGLLRT